MYVGIGVCMSVRMCGDAHSCTCPQHSLVTTPNAPDEGRWLELAQVIEHFTGQVRALADLESERALGFEQTSGHLQEAVWAMEHRQGTGANGAGERMESNSLVGKNAIPEGPSNRSSFKPLSRRYTLGAGAKDERFNVLLERAEAREPNAPAVNPAAGNKASAARLAQHI